MKDIKMFPMRDNVYLVPHWVMASLKRRGLSAVDLLNYGKIDEVLSMSDKIGIEAAQSLSEMVFGSRDAGSRSILYEWICTANEAQQVVINTQLEVLSKDPHQRDALKARLFSEGSASLSGKAFEVLAVEDKCFVVVLYPSFFVDSQGNPKHTSNQAPLVRELIQNLYVFDEPTAVAGTPMFTQYLENLYLHRKSH